MASVSRVAAILSGILVLALLAGGLTEATLAIGHSGRITDDRSLRPAQATPTASPRGAKPSATPTASVKPTASPTVTPMPTPAGPTATTNSFVHLRAGKSTSTTILADLDGGTVVQLLPDSDAQWQEVRYNGLTGYIFKSYLAY